MRWKVSTKLLVVAHPQRVAVSVTDAPPASRIIASNTRTRVRHWGWVMPNFVLERGFSYGAASGLGLAARAGRARARAGAGAAPPVPLLGGVQTRPARPPRRSRPGTAAGVTLGL